MSITLLELQFRAKKIESVYDSVGFQITDKSFGLEEDAKKAYKYLQYTTNTDDFDVRR